MWPYHCVSQKLTFPLLFGASLHIFSYPCALSLRDTVLLWLFIVPALLIPNTTSAVCTCYIFAGNSSERQRKTWIVKMTCRETHECVLCMGVQSAANNQKPYELNCQWLHLLSRESFRALQRWWKKHSTSTRTNTTHGSVTLAYMKKAAPSNAIWSENVDVVRHSLATIHSPPWMF